MIFKPNFERGQALVIITFAIIRLVGITGLAIDGGLAFSGRRRRAFIGVPEKRRLPGKC